jgi:hypothetical protein
MKKLNTNESGFSAVELALVLITLAVVGTAGFLVAKHIDSKKIAAVNNVITTSPAKQSTPTPTASIAPSTTTQSTSTSYLNIPEWGIKVKLGTADPNHITYTLSGPSSGPTGNVAASASLSLKSSITTNTHCQSLGIGIDQGIVSDYNVTGTPPNVVGKYYYTVGGSPFSCGDTTLDTLRAQYVGNNPSTWVYSSIN